MAKNNSLQKYSKHMAITMVAYAALISTLTVACQKAEWRDVKAPNTGDAATEYQTGDLAQTNVRLGQQAYIAPERLRGRETPEQNPEDASLLLEQGDQVEVIDPNPQGTDKLIAVRAIDPSRDRSNQAASQSGPVTYIPKNYLNSIPITSTVSQQEADRYIVIENIATEKLRIYEVSNSIDVPNKLILETDMIAGENDPAKTRRTAVGSYKILSWHKFYQDNQNLFPSWYDPEYPTLPLPGASLEDWSQKHFLPITKQFQNSVQRGSFGWFTAKIGPNAFAQWTHGTLGWGADRGRFIQLPKSQLAQFYSDPRSFGCSRVENQAIAFMQDLLPVGTRVVKIYAKESESGIRAKESELKTWDWILTKEEIRSSQPHSINRPEVLLRGTPSEEYLESGTFHINTKATAVTFKKTVHGKRLSATIIRPEANLYDLKEGDFKGEFLVNEGKLLSYSHPKQLRKGGYTDNLLPKAISK